MKSQAWKHAVVVVGFTVLTGAPGGALGADPDWKGVEQALGKSGQLQAGDVFRVGMPRTDLSVTVKGVLVKPGFALGSYAAFKQVGDQAMVMGDLVLLDQEVPGVMSGLFRGGLEVTAVHNHLNEMSPHVMYMHYEGHGDAAQLAKALRQALSASGTPPSAVARRPPRPPVPRSTPSRSSRDWDARVGILAAASSRSPCRAQRPSRRWGIRCCPPWA